MLLQRLQLSFVLCAVTMATACFAPWHCPKHNLPLVSLPQGREKPQGDQILAEAQDLQGNSRSTSAFLKEKTQVNLACADLLRLCSWEVPKRTGWRLDLLLAGQGTPDVCQGVLASAQQKRDL